MRQIAERCTRDNETIVFSKFEVATHQLDAAIYNLFLGNWPASITLAGAAEEVLPRVTTQPDLFTFLKKRAAIDENVDADAIGKKLNELRNWSKHYCTPVTGDQEFSQGDAVSMILRAHSRLYFQSIGPQNNYFSTPAQDVFVEWFKVNYMDWLDPKEKDGK